MEALAIAARLAQFAGAAVLLGWPLLQLYAPSTPSRSDRAVLAAAAVALLTGALLALPAQGAAMAGDAAAATDPAILWTVLAETDWGRGLAARLALGLLAAVAVALGAPSAVIAALGAGVCASFAWTGHAVGGEGVPSLIHRGADVLHLLAAGVWLGALPAMLGRVIESRRSGDPTAAAAALARFSGVGPTVVAVLVLSGLVNSWMLVGPAGAARLLESPYGIALALKLVLFAGMLGLAAANRWRLAPRLGTGDHALIGLRLSLMVETGLGVLVLAAVAVLGTLPPPSEGI